ncbi:MAG: ComF family protein [Akkermansia sp.]
MEILTGSAEKTPARSRAHAPRQTGSKGYNQAQELAVLLGEELGWPYAGVLKRLPDTLPQASLSREQRLRHARNYTADEKG